MYGRMKQMTYTYHKRCVKRTMPLYDYKRYSYYLLTTMELESADSPNQDVSPEHSVMLFRRTVYLSRQLAATKQ